MLQNKLYTISSFEFSDAKDRISAHILLNKEHLIFGGHFPGNPILPGVCTIQIIRELLEKAVEKELQLTRASNIKYLGFINPVTTPAVQFDLVIKNTESGSISCNAMVSADGNTLCSFKGEYVHPKSSSHIQL
jgi:3-hydroxyacyl-[acyl-carrier-protein] dehydratase